MTHPIHRTPQGAWLIADDEAILCGGPDRKPSLRERLSLALAIYRSVTPRPSAAAIHAAMKGFTLSRKPRHVPAPKLTDTTAFSPEREWIKFNENPCADPQNGHGTDDTPADSRSKKS